jgi:methionyl-tRNA formyltransferase
MRVVFMGTPQFAVPSLGVLVRSHDLVAVYSRPDRTVGRGRGLKPTPVKVAAAAAGVPVRQPERFTAAGVVEALAADRPDVVVVAAFGAILPQAVLDVPVFGCINVHASLLPRWRGAAPIQRAILAGDETTGVSIMRMEAGLDTGPWCAQRSVGVDAKSADELGDELALCGASLLAEVLPHLADGRLTWYEQDPRQATYAAKVTSADVGLLPDQSVREVLARVRASGSSAPCRVVVADRAVTVLRASVSPDQVAPGMAHCAKHLDLGCADGTVRLEAVVPEGRSAMDGGAFVRGARLPIECPWSGR